jgi:hypothetical protein
VQKLYIGISHGFAWWAGNARLIHFPGKDLLYGVFKDVLGKPICICSNTLKIFPLTLTDFKQWLHESLTKKNCTASYKPSDDFLSYCVEKESNNVVNDFSENMVWYTDDDVIINPCCLSLFELDKVSGQVLNSKEGQDLIQYYQVLRTIRFFFYRNHLAVVCFAFMENSGLSQQLNQTLWIKNVMKIYTIQTPFFIAFYLDPQLAFMLLIPNMFLAFCYASSENLSKTHIFITAELAEWLFQLNENIVKSQNVTEQGPKHSRFEALLTQSDSESEHNLIILKAGVLGDDENPLDPITTVVAVGGKLAQAGGTVIVSEVARLYASPIAQHLKEGLDNAANEVKKHVSESISNSMRDMMAQPLENPNHPLREAVGDISDGSHSFLQPTSKK